MSSSSLGGPGCASFEFEGPKWPQSPFPRGVFIKNNSDGERIGGIMDGQVEAAIPVFLQAGRAGDPLGPSRKAERRLLHDIGLYLEYQSSI